jgi:hypothetical protein
MIKIFQRLYSTVSSTATERPKAPRPFNYLKINQVFVLLRNVFQSRSHQSFEMKAWKAYLDLGSEKAKASPVLYCQILIFISANNIFSPKHKKLAFERVGKDILFSRDCDRKSDANWNWDFLCFYAKLYQSAFTEDGVNKSIADLKHYFMNGDPPTSLQLEDILAAMVYVRFIHNGIQDTFNWMEELLEIDWETPYGMIRIPWSARACKIVHKKLQAADISCAKFLFRCSEFGIHFDNSLFEVRMLLKAGDVKGAIKLAETCPEGSMLVDGINEMIGNHILCRWASESKIINSGMAKG